MFPRGLVFGVGCPSVPSASVCRVLLARWCCARPARSVMFTPPWPSGGQLGVRRPAKRDP
eukprot:8954331-Lingulodinium_polyedra.AAC.1